MPKISSPLPIQKTVAKIKPGKLDDRRRMRALARFTARTRQGTHPTPFGSEVVETATGRSVACEVNEGMQHTDPTLHAEVNALRVACRKLGTMTLRGHTLYTTCEPCPMCMAAAIWAGVDRVVYGATIDDAARFCSQIYTYAKTLARKSDITCRVVGPVERAACVKLFTTPRMRAVFKTWRHHK